MSWGKSNTPTKSPAPAGIDSDDLSTNEQAVPVPWWIGLNWVPLTWVVDKVYNQRAVEIRMKTGKSDTVTGYKYYGDVAGIAGIGLSDKILAFESGNDLAWTGSISRPDDPDHPDYWRTQIATSIVDLAFYWGRADQPVDDLLLAAIGAADATLAHPAYRNQQLAVLRNYYFGQNTQTVPSSRVLVWRSPKPEIGTFAAQFADGGESVVAGILELATSPIFGAGAARKHFIAGEWEALSTLVLSSVGGVSPSLDRSVQLRDAVKDLQSYYDGWTRFENGRLKPGRFPHDGTVPAGLTELSVHDFIDRPKIQAGTPSSTINDVRVTYRDRDDMLKKKPVSRSASANVKARKGHEPRQLEMLGFITSDQASRWAAEAAVTGAEGEWSGEGLKVRGPRAKWADGSRLQAGDNFNLDLIAPEVDQVSRITRRVDFFRAAPTIDVIAERGVFPTPYVPPTNLRPDIGKVIPLEIANARVWELTTAMAGSPLGLPVSMLAKRPKSTFEGAALAAANVLGFNIWYGGAAGATYDMVGNMPAWAIRGVVRLAIANSTADVVVKLTLDADNLDLTRLAAQSSEGQKNDNLLIVIGDEVFSVGAIALSGLNYDFSCKRVRQGTLAAAHLLAAEAWVVWRDEVRSFIHAGFVEDTDRYFKLQPYTQSALVPLADVDPLVYHFRDRDDEKPVIVMGALPASPVVGVGYSISGQISDVNGDLVSYQVQAVKLVGTGGAIDSEMSLQAGDVKPDAKALLAFKAPLVFPIVGVWVIIVRAYDERTGFTEFKSAEMNVAVGSGVYGPDDGITPDPVSNVTISAGLGMLVIEWDNPTNTPLDVIWVYEASTNSMPALPSFILHGSQDFLFRENLPYSATRYYWFKVKARNGRFSAPAGEFHGTTRSGINLADIIPGMTLVEIVATLPSSGNFNGRFVVLTTDGKLYRYNAGAWTTAVAAVDLTGQIVSGQIADAAVLTAKLADNAISQAKLQTNIIDTAYLVANAVTAAKIGAGEVGSAALAAAAVTLAKMAANSVDNAQLVASAVDAAKIATNAVTTTKISDNAIVSAKIAAGEVQAANIAAGAIVAGKIAANAVTTTELAANAVTAAKIAAGEVTTAKLAAGAVTANELAANSIIAAKIGAGEVVAGKIAANAVTTTELAANAVTAAKIAAGEVTTAKLAAGAVTANELAANSVVAAKIAAGEVTTAKLAAGAVTANELAANSIIAAKIAAGAITAAAVGANEIIANSANIANAIITSAKIASIAAAKIDAGDITTVNLARASKLYHPSYPANKFLATVYGTIFSVSPFTWHAGSGYPDLVPAMVMYCPGHASWGTAGTLKVCPDDDGNVKVTFNVAIRQYAVAPDAVTIFCRVNGGSFNALASASDPYAYSTARSISASVGDKIEVFIFPGDSSGNLSHDVTADYVMEATIDNW